MSRILNERRHERVAFSLQMLQNETQSTWFFLKWSKSAEKCYRHTLFPSKNDQKVLKSAIGICRLRTKVITKRWKLSQAYAVVYRPHFMTMFCSRRILTTLSQYKRFHLHIWRQSPSMTCWTSIRVVILTTTTLHDNTPQGSEATPIFLRS